MTVDPNDPFVAMTLQPTKAALVELGRLKATGEKLVTAICKTGAELFQDVFAPQQSGASFRFTFYGIKLLTRVELPLDENAQPRLSTYMCDENIPPRLEPLGPDYSFDKLGNVNRNLTIDDAAIRFVPNLLNQLRATKASLLP